MTRENEAKQLRMEVTGQSAGWIFLQFWLGEGTAELECSAAFPPFYEFAVMLHQLHNGANEATLDVDQEGYFKRLQFRRISGDIFSFEIRGEYLEVEQEEGYFSAFHASSFDKKHLLEYEIDLEMERKIVEDTISIEEYYSYFPNVYISDSVEKNQAIDVMCNTLKDFFNNAWDPEAHGHPYSSLFQRENDALNFSSKDDLWKNLEED